MKRKRSDIMGVLREIKGHLIFAVCLCRLDVGNGKELDLKECPRSKLRQQCIKYMGPVSSSLDHIH